MNAGTEHNYKPSNSVHSRRRIPGFNECGGWPPLPRVMGSKREHAPIGQFFVPIFGGEDGDILLLVGDQQFSWEAPPVDYFFSLKD